MTLTVARGRGGFFTVRAGANYRPPELVTDLGNGLGTLAPALVLDLHDGLGIVLGATVTDLGNGLGSIAA